MNFYAVLGIPRDADAQVIRSAYRTLARRYHPDRGAGSSPEKFRQVTEAYETLRNPGSRDAYDLSLQRAERTSTIRAEPMVSPSGPFRPEDAAVLGHFERAPRGSAFQSGYRFDHLGFDDLIGLLDSFDDWFFGWGQRR